MGIARFFLALLVLTSHSTVSTFGFNIGVSAVICFFIISGYLNTLLINKYYNEKNLNQILSYYKDRLFRICPQFFFYFIIIVIINYYLNIFEINLFQILLNAPIISLGYYMILDNITGIEFIFVNRPTWSLGLELTFYLLIPFTLKFSKKQIINFFFLSLVFYLLTFFLRSDYNQYFGYRLIPGTMFIFLIGSFLYFKESSYLIIIRIILVIFVILLSLISITGNYYMIPYNRDVIIGVIFGIIILNFTKDLRITKIDKFLGDLSYGIFLNHYFIFQIIREYYSFGSFLELVLTIILSMLFSIISYNLIEKPALNIRKKIRYKI